ncbi:unnamed protein product [Blepharisma stoltei]|uniref:Histone-lysine N-methyltransferase, H3 lysine-79 specific n=1 Tax=Blepharisma stoltei TaxID=1481888 RepID=A0AAU9J3J5_9CILI|nr:unnamed protein product [Blepharisma stoltei]
MNGNIDEFIVACIMNDYKRDDPYILSDAEREEIEAKQMIYQSLISDINIEIGQEASKKDRKLRGDENLSDDTLTYGEIDFIPLAEIIFTIKNRYGGCREGNFYDLGSGTGKPVIAAALLGNFLECKGIELLSSLYEVSLTVKERYDRWVQTQECMLPNNSYPKVSMILDDIFEYDWSDADLILANSTCYDENMIEKIGKIEVSPGTFSISLSNSLPVSSWRIVESVRKRMSWGIATVYIQQKIDLEEERLKILEFGKALDSE